MGEKPRNVSDGHGPLDNIVQLQDEVLATFDDFPDPFSTLTTTYMQGQTIQDVF